MTTFKNLTPHEINVHTPNGVCTFKTSGQVARVESESEPVGTFRVDGLRVPVGRTVFGAPVNLPEPEEGVVLIVSMLVRLAVPNRGDVVSPGELVRDELGRPVGCTGFVCN